MTETPESAEPEMPPSPESEGRRKPGRPRKGSQRFDLSPDGEWKRVPGGAWEPNVPEPSGRPPFAPQVGEISANLKVRVTTGLYEYAEVGIFIQGQPDPTRTITENLAAFSAMARERAEITADSIRQAVKIGRE